MRISGPLSVILTILLLALCGRPAQATIVAGQVDDFELGGPQAWQVGNPTNPNPPANITSGGPAGADDNYLLITSSGVAGPGGKLVVINHEQWAGNYLTAGISSIQMQVNNLGSTDLVLRLILNDSTDGLTLTTVTPVPLAAGSGWSPVSFSLAPSNLVGGSFETAMSNVVELNLVHSPNIIAFRSSAPNIAAQLGIDNITAAPVPFPGDANGDRVVDFADLGILLNNYNQAGTFALGDFDRTGTVDFTDLGILLNNYNQQAPTLSSNVAVPEPSTLALSLAGFTLLAIVRRRTMQ